MQTVIKEEVNVRMAIKDNIGKRTVGKEIERTKVLV